MTLDQRSVLLRFLRWNLPVSLMILLGGLSVALIQIRKIDSDTAHYQISHVDRASYGLEKQVAKSVQHLQSLAIHELGTRRVLNGESPVSAMEDAFTSLLSRNPEYLTMRWIGMDGKERVRVDRTRGGLIQVTPENELQDKSKRYFFSETLKQGRGDVYLSPLDLNVEHGQIEIPYQPVIRMGARVYNWKGTPLGIFILNVGATPMLEELSGSSGQDEMMLVNEQGYWLKGEDPAREWGFMFNRPDTLGQQYPDAWRHISTEETGRVLTDKGAWQWRTVHATPAGSSQTETVNWKVISRRPPHAISRQHETVWAVIIAGQCLLLLAFGIASWKLAHEVEVRVRTEQQLKDETLLLKAVGDLSPTGLAFFNAQKQLEGYNAQFPLVMQIPAELITQEKQGFDDLIRYLHQRGDYGDEPLEHAQARFNVVFAGQTLHFERRMQDGRTLDAHIVPLKDGGCLLSYHDISAQKDYAARLEQQVEERTQQLSEAMQAAEAAHVAKSNFLGNMSHEMRTPLHQLLALLPMIRKEPLTDKQTDRLGKVEMTARRLNNLVDGILKLTEMESARLAFREQPFDLAELMREAMAESEERGQEKGLQMRMHEPPPLPGIKGDRSHLKTGLLCYLNNAVTFTEQGQINLSVQVADEAPDSLLLRFEVRDTGIGIAPEVLPRLFNIFEQADNSQKRKYGGTGVGLALVRKLAVAMGGEAGCDSQVGQGSTFWFSARLKKTAETQV
ncbi:ATP-binding protein [Azovibrio restrictus]|uniref:sensor histidine kinase n=1 Tax=Azovibrio restrictus TaxID=146938 RepID=UPI0026EB3A80|nr:ATP-binding protein [Azovibrio restrictus]MDD3481313.1 ATP-binding protein [Azovibrio restrictus]